MNKKIQQQLKEKMENEKALIQEELKSFADAPKADTDYRTRFPQFGNHTAEQDENAEEVEKYTQNLSIEYTLETKLKEIENALQKLKTGTYGLCERCKKQIPIERLEAAPSARTCINCKSLMT